jgi:hypothetical protein
MFRVDIIHGVRRRHRCVYRLLPLHCDVTFSLDKADRDGIGLVGYLL